MTAIAAKKGLELVEFEKVVARGTSTQKWTIFANGRWLAVSKIVGASITKRPNHPGVVWERSVQFHAPAGTRLRCTVESPRAQQLRDVFKIMTLDASSTRRAVTIEYEWTCAGSLERRRP